MMLLCPEQEEKWYRPVKVNHNTCYVYIIHTVHHTATCTTLLVLLKCVYNSYHNKEYTQQFRYTPMFTLTHYYCYVHTHTHTYTYVQVTKRLAIGQFLHTL